MWWGNRIENDVDAAGDFLETEFGGDAARGRVILAHAPNGEATRGQNLVRDDSGGGGGESMAAPVIAGEDGDVGIAWRESGRVGDGDDFAGNDRASHQPIR